MGGGGGGAGERESTYKYTGTCKQRLREHKNIQVLQAYRACIYIHTNLNDA